MHRAAVLPLFRYQMATPRALTDEQKGKRMSDLPPERLDSRTPPEVNVTAEAAPPFDDPTVGIDLGAPNAAAPLAPTDPAHPLVTMGDSLTHGVSSGAVFRTDVSWPALVAGALAVDGFKVPVYRGPLDGLPLNLEALARQLETRFGDDLNVIETLQLPLVVQHLLDQNEDYWERGPGSAPAATGERYANLGIYGWDVRDALSYTAGRASARARFKSDDGLLGFKPEHDNDIAASSVLAPFGVAATQVEAAAWHGRNGGIGTLVVALGANNALGAVVHKRVKWSGGGYDDLDHKGDFNVWRPNDFAREYGLLVRRLRTVAAHRVLLATVPHVTIAPIAKGVNPNRPGEKWRAGSRYFPYYTDPWIDEVDFRPAKHRHLTHQQARAIDSAIDQYNETIAEAVRQARGDGREWFVLDLCGLLDRLAYRRYVKDDAARARNGVPVVRNGDAVEHKLPEAIEHLDSRFFLSDRSGVLQGGLFGLDGIHPTTVGYGLVAKEVLAVLARAGVPSKPIDFNALLAADTLNSQPPALVTQALKLIAPIATRFVSQR